MDRGVVSHILGKNGYIIKDIEEFNSVLTGTQDLDNFHELVLLFGPPVVLPQAKMVVVCLSHGIGLF